MTDLEAQIQSELQCIVEVVTEMTGLASHKVMNAHDEARECLMDQVVGATTLEEIAEAWKALKE